MSGPTCDSLETIPCRVLVTEVLSGRYDAGAESSLRRPLSWDERFDGKDVVKTECGKTLCLYSDGQQSTPKEGWKLLVTGGESEGYTWTLYGMPA